MNPESLIDPERVAQLDTLSRMVWSNQPQPSWASDEAWMVAQNMAYNSGWRPRDYKEHQVKPGIRTIFGQPGESVEDM